VPLPARLSCALTVLAIAACAPAPQETAAASAADPAADRARIDEIVAALDAAYSAEDFQAAQTNFAESIVHMPPTADAVVGAAAVRARDSVFSTDYDDQLASTIEDVVIDGDWAVVRLKYTETWTPRSSTGTAGGVTGGKTLLVLRRQPDGAWKITHYMWNPSQAAQ
jgi:ketosteroid isomerase-like protein